MLGRVACLAGRALSHAVGQASPALQGLQAEALTALTCSSGRLQGAMSHQQQGMATNSHDILNTHKDTPHNNANTTFEWSPANLKTAQEIISRYPANYKASAVIPVLDLAQQQNAGWLSLAALNSVAKLLDMAEIRVYEVATFYTMFNRSKMGKYHVMICGTTPCRVVASSTSRVRASRLQGALKIQEAVENFLGVHIGETTKDGLFTLGEMECMGACVNAPMIAVADYSNGVEGFSYTYYEDLTPEDVVAVLDTLKKGGKPKKGSQHRTMAEPTGCVAGGKWIPSKGVQTLMGAIRGPYAPNPALN